MRIVTQQKFLKVAFILILAFAASLSAQNYMGSNFCGNCHGNLSNFAGDQWLHWSETLHAKAIQDPDAGILPDVAAAFKANLDLSANAKFSAYGANAPKLSYNAATGTNPGDFNSGYRVTIGNVTYTVNRVHGGNWKQRFHTKIGNSFYILPIQYNPEANVDGQNQGWTTYDPALWYNAGNQPLYTSQANLAADIVKKDAYERRCEACHSTNPSISFNSGNGEYTSTFTEQNIGCESCHGPGSAHPGADPSSTIINPKNDLSSLQRALELCGQCHNRGTSTATLGGNNLDFPYNASTGAYRPNNVLSDFFNSTTKATDFWADGITSKSHRQQALDFQRSTHAQYDPAAPWRDLTCFTCHSAHEDTPNKHQVVKRMRNSHTGDVEIDTKTENNTLCLSCHATHGPFANITVDMVKNYAANEAAIGAEVTKHTNHSYDPENKNNTGGASNCTQCHMSKVGRTAQEYDLHHHTFDVIPPQRTIIHQAGMPNACATACHRNPPAGSKIPGFGIVDANIATWNEATDIALANELMKYYGPDGTWWKRTVTSVAEGPSDAAPESFALWQNYPNPFNAGTIIRFDLKQSGPVSLKVFDLLGKEMVTLVDENMPAGSHWIGFHRGEMASGVYFYKLTANNFVATKKFIVMR